MRRENARGRSGGSSIFQLFSLREIQRREEKGDQFVFRATDVRYPFYFLGEMAGKTLATNW